MKFGQVFKEYKDGPWKRFTRNRAGTKVNGKMNIFAIIVKTTMKIGDNKVEYVAGNQACNSMTKDHWQFPSQGRVKVNVNSSVSTFKPRTAIGGVVRGLDGSWIGGFEMVVEWRLRVIIQNGLATNNNYNKVKLIQDWCHKSWEVKFRQTLRESNRVVDCLTKEARGKMEQLIIHEEPPASVRSLLNNDNHCASYPLFEGV
ncbi:hypothetical protein J1N35_018411 [Gossypium stocksii]|uniref:RNase H type-1 domain-containing protein n=1 Tax=Gossypium stocksii TaxID=47602 RepID=A0A9D3VP55_9ROSI|nr:hypothetical protein J1N35_018411 [Gossypium stocksii]